MMALWRIILWECQSLWQDKRALSFYIGAPFLLMALLGGVFLHHYVSELPIAVVDSEFSTQSRMIAQGFDYSPRFALQLVTSDREEAYQALQQKKWLWW